MEFFNCCVCGVKIGIETGYLLALKRDGTTFFCLNGHPQIIPGETQIDKLKEINQNIKTEYNKRIAELNEQIINLKKLENKCSHCYKKFSSKYNLKRHESMHKKVR